MDVSSKEAAVLIDKAIAFLKSKKIVDIPQFSSLENKKASDLPIAEQLQLAYFIRHHYKNSII